MTQCNETVTKTILRLFNQYNIIIPSFGIYLYPWFVKYKTAIQFAKLSVAVMKV